MNSIRLPHISKRPTPLVSTSEVSTVSIATKAEMLRRNPPEEQWNKDPEPTIYIVLETIYVFSFKKM